MPSLERPIYLLSNRPLNAFSAELRARLERMGHQIGGNDLSIVAQSISLGFTLVTTTSMSFHELPNCRAQIGCVKERSIFRSHGDTIRVVTHIDCARSAVSM